MLTPDQVSVMMPTSSDDIDAITDDLMAVLKTFSTYEEANAIEFIEWLRDNPDVIIMIYVDGAPAGYVRFDDQSVNGDVGRKCLEMGGGILPEYEGQGLVELVGPLAIDQAFSVHGKKKMIARTAPGQIKEAAALENLGFNQVAVEDDGTRIYRLLRKDHAKALSA